MLCSERSDFLTDRIATHRLSSRWALIRVYHWPLQKNVSSTCPLLKKKRAHVYTMSLSHVKKRCVARILASAARHVCASHLSFPAISVGCVQAYQCIYITHLLGFVHQVLKSRALRLLFWSGIMVHVAFHDPHAVFQTLSSDTQDASVPLGVVQS